MHDVEVIFHLAAQIHVDRSIIEPKLTYEINVLGTQNILDVSRMYDVNRIVYASSSEVYGSAEYTPMDERHPLNAPHPYGASKIAADKVVESFYCSYECPVVTIRPFNTFGPRQSARAVIPNIITQALSKKEIFMGSLEPTRDFTFVKDIVRGFL